MKILATDRLLLRWFDADDAGFVRALLNDPGWLAFIGDRGVRNDDDARRWIAERLVEPCWQQGFGFWAVQRRDDGALAGLAGLTRRDGLDAMDLGYAFLPAHRGQGLAREAAAACLAYARDVLGQRRVLAITKPGNAASARVLEAIGMTARPPRRLPGEDEDSCVFGWDDPSPAPDDAARIDALLRRFYGAFRNRGGAIPALPALPAWCWPGLRIRCTTPQGVTDTDLRQFMQPRAALLTGGRLTEFDEWETEARTERHGRIAQRWSCYAKAGLLDGAPYGGEGRKSFQLLRGDDGDWRIAALAWEDL